MHTPKFITIVFMMKWVWFVLLRTRQEEHDINLLAYSSYFTYMFSYYIFTTILVTFIA